MNSERNAAYISGLLAALFVTIFVWGATRTEITTRPSPPADRAGASAERPRLLSAPARPIISTGPLWPQPTEAQQRDRRAEVNRFYAALRQYESANGAYPFGDKGKSRGYYHIGQLYFDDATEYMTGWQWPRDVMDRDKSEFLISCYMHRHAYLAWMIGDWETCARIHNGGPDGDVEAATLEYWGKVKELMQ